MNRRGFLRGMAGILAAGVAPAVIPSGILMPVRQLWTPPSSGQITTVSLQASADGILWIDLGDAGQILSSAKEMNWVIERPERYLRMVTTHFTGHTSIRIGA